MIEELLTAGVRVGTPLALAAIGEAIAEQGGVINLGIEGAMLAGALGAAMGASAAGPAAGVGVAILTGTAAAAVFAAVAIGAKANQIITGTAVTLLLTGLTGLIARQFFGAAGAGLSLPTLAPIPLPGLSRIPLLGEVFFDQSLLTYAAYLLVPLATWLIFRTRFGLELRASGASVPAATAAGVRVARVRTIGVVIGGATAGLAGASLVLAQVGTFTERMTAGRGFIAIAIVVLGRKHPVGVALAALLFGGATAVQYVVQAGGSGLPYQLWQALPYLLALGVLATSTRNEKREVRSERTPARYGGRR